MSNIRSRFSLLAFEPALVVFPSLAKAVGLYQAIVMQQVNYSIQSGNPNLCTVFKDGNGWTNLTLEGWFGTQLGMIMSMPTLKRTFQSLEKSGLLEACQPDGTLSRKKYYRIPDSVIVRLTPDRIHELTGCTPWDQFDPIEGVSLIPSSLEEYNRSPEYPNVLRSAQSIGEVPERTSNDHTRFAHVVPTGEKMANAMEPPKGGSEPPPKNLKDHPIGSNGVSSKATSRIDASAKQMLRKALVPESAPPPPPGRRIRRRSLHQDLCRELKKVCGNAWLEANEDPWPIIGKAVAEIRESIPDATPDKIRFIAKGYRKKYPDAAMTPTALSKWCQHALKEMGALTPMGQT